jgi:hypothetical protein
VKKGKYSLIFYSYLIFSWVEKKDVKSKGGPIPVKNQRHMTTATKIQNNVSTVTPMRSTNIYADLKSDASSDLASKLKPTRR